MTMRHVAHQTGSLVSFKWQDGRRLTGVVRRHKWIRTPKNALGLIYTVDVDGRELAVAGQRLQAAPVDSEKVEAAENAPANPHDAGSPGHPCGYGAEQDDYDATVAHMGREW